jgi:hypothetical protein
MDIQLQQPGTHRLHAGQQDITTWQPTMHTVLPMPYIDKQNDDSDSNR